jgi:sphingomyelin phosphodiesterase acid-like 3
MKSTLVTQLLRTAAAMLCIFLFAAAVPAQQADAPVSAVLVSDIHFDPFWDPAQTVKLATAPVSEWKAILSATPAANHESRFNFLQKVCHARGEDTSYPLLAASLQAMRKPGAGAKFVTVSGDLLAHSFQCKYKTVFPKSTAEDYRKFSEETIAYVIGGLENTFPDVPVYTALGNNDSDCGDYRLDAHSEFLADVGAEVTRSFPAAERQAALESFKAGGAYSVALPLHNARLLVVDDLFMSSNYHTCGGKADPTAADAQLAWLRQQLVTARAKKQKIWVMGHIPPGVDLHASVAKFDDVCGGQGPEMFLGSEKLADELVEFGDVVTLTIFAHTHMDEMHLLQSTAEKSVAVKMVASISPINGNHPSFTIAQIDPATATLRDYKVFAAPSAKGLDAVWPEEYDFAHDYHAKDFSSTSVSKLIGEFAADREAKSQTSQSYLRNFRAGDTFSLLQAFWPQYVCTLSNYTTKGFRVCVCGNAAK